MRAFITGISGFVGTYLYEHLISAGDEVYGLIPSFDALADLQWGKALASQAMSRQTRAANYTDLNAVDQNGREALFLGDVSNFETVKQAVFQVEPDIIYHLAGISFVPDAGKDLNNLLRVNVGGTWSVIKAADDFAKTHPEREVRLLIVSTSEVFSKQLGNALLNEKSEVFPLNPYGMSKLLAENLVKTNLSSNLLVTIARPFNHIGPRQSPNFVVSSFAKQLAQISAGYAPARMSVGNLYAYRDFSDVRDIVAAYRLMAFAKPGVYVLGSGKPVSIRHVLESLMELAKVDVKIEVDPRLYRPASEGIVGADPTLARKTLGWQSTYALSDTLRNIYVWWLNNP